MTSPHLPGGSEMALDMKVRPNAVGNRRAERGDLWLQPSCLFQTSDSAVSSWTENLLLGKTVPNDILLLGNICLEMISDSAGAPGDCMVPQIYGSGCFSLPSHTVQIKSTALQPLLQTCCQVCRRAI